MKALLEQVVDEQTLKLAFLRSRRSLWTSNSPLGRQFLQIWYNWSEESNRLRTELLEGSYQPEGLRAALVTSGRSNKKRGIYRSAVRDRWVQQAVHDVISPRLTAAIATPASYGRAKVKGESSRSIGRLAQEIFSLVSTQAYYVYETDIKDFFPSIDREKLLLLLDFYLGDHSLNTLLPKLISTTVADYEGEAAEPEYRHLWNTENGIAQGSILSPLFANTYLGEFDRQMGKEGWHLFRYIDDLVVFCADKEDAVRASNFVTNYMDRIGLAVHPLVELQSRRSKAAIRELGQSLNFVGVVFSQSRMKPTDSAEGRLLKRIAEVCFSEDEAHLTVLERLNKCNRLIEGWHGAYSFCRLPREYRRLIDRKISGILDTLLRNNSLLPNGISIKDITYARQLGVIQMADLTIRQKWLDDMPEPSVKELSEFDLIDGVDMITEIPNA